MPLTARQSELADAALDILGSSGMAAVTYRRVASTTGWSLGAVQKAFGTRDEIIRAMFIRLREQENVEDSISTDQSVVDGLVGWVLAHLPLDAERRAAVQRTAAFIELARREPPVGRAIAASDAARQKCVAAVIRQGIERGEVPARVDATSVAWALQAFARGLAAQLTLTPARDDLSDDVRGVVRALLHFDD